MPPPEPGVTPPVLVLLAAGEGSRMGRPKALLDFHGTPWLEHQLSVFATAGGRQAVIMLGTEAPRHYHTLPWLPHPGTWTPWNTLSLATCLNPDPTRGLTSSLHLALTLVPDHGVLVQPVDIPLPPPDLLATLCATPLDPRDSLQPANGPRRGHPLRLGPELATLLSRQDPDDPTRRLDHDVARLARHRLTLPTDSPLPFLNLNEPADWERFLTEHGSKNPPLPNR
jgi:CTP:molybdopterin cytidylyltransferase MocA